MKYIIIWFRRNLRCHNNPTIQWALEDAINENKRIIAIYIDDPEDNNIWKIGSASKWWLHHSLKSFHYDLRQKNIKLNFYQGDTLSVIKDLSHRYPIHSIVWHTRYEPFEQTIENKVSTYLEQSNINAIVFNDHIIQRPNELLNQQSKPYRVFTAFYKKTHNICLPDTTVLQLGELEINGLSIKDQQAKSLNSLQLLDHIPWHDKLAQHWSPGETTAHNRLKQFINDLIEYYPVQRDFPATNQTSLLSPHLHFGEISIQGIYSYLSQLQIMEPKLNEAISIFIRQLFWREFAAYLLWHFPQSTTEPMNSKFAMNFWQKNTPHYQLWCNGKTGIDIIDAGMQQLWKSGWMHNRVRMVSASFLTKNLGVSWLSGAQWFWDTLVDADLANNSMGWQWVAGCGVDAAPYFRIFNPHRQVNKFDPDRKYIQSWLKKTSEFIPIVDLKQSREEALQRYQAI